MRFKQKLYCSLIKIQLFLELLADNLIVKNTLMRVTGTFIICI